ncbi:hypothetical protein [Paraburkholderia sp. RL18-085-BIA-A]|uniref:hypothetical protein n=1 Tax=Paraburkholderia sp. RL18-085-BIA-A TaxID=3031633 RepID=UPI0038B97A02
MKISIPGFIYAKGTRHLDVATFKMVEGPEYSFWTSGDLHKSEHFRDLALVGPHEIIADIPDSFDPRQQLAENLKAEKKRLMADFNKRITDIDRQIQEYLAIEAVS